MPLREVATLHRTEPADFIGNFGAHQRHRFGSGVLPLEGRAPGPPVALMSASSACTATINCQRLLGATALTRAAADADHASARADCTSGRVMGPESTEPGSDRMGVGAPSTAPAS